MNDYFNGLSKWVKRSIALSSDIVMTFVAFKVADWLLSNNSVLQNSVLLEVLIIQSMVYILCGLYRGIWRFASIPDLVRILNAVVLSILSTSLFFNIQGHANPGKHIVVYSLLLIVLLVSPRLVYRWANDYRRVNKGKRILIVGAGYAGERLIRDLNRSSLAKDFFPVGIVDDDPSCIGSEIHNVRVLGNCESIPELVKKLKIELVFIAIPSAGSIRMREIIRYCEKVNVSIRTLPSLKDIADGIVNVNSLREVLLEDLLGREQVVLDWDAIKHAIYNKVVLVTGGGGSIGSELCRQISSLSPQRLIIVDNNEFNLYTIDLELKNKYARLPIITQLCSTTDKIELAKIFSLYKPQLVFHVAAYKHVPLLETQLRVSMFNNIIGTRITAELAHENHTETFILISTDKAVNPTNIMGATKRASEVFCQNFNIFSTTKFSTVRFGNVLESTGSVIPLFRKQLKEGGPLTVTHANITRYFMTIPEASQLILQAVTMNEVGQIFVLDMGEPINIGYLAEQLIKLSGKTIGKDIQIEYIGLRPGEKLHEELFHENEGMHDTHHPKIKRADARLYDWNQLQHIMNAIESACLINDEKSLRELLHQLVPEFKDPDYIIPASAVTLEMTTS